MKYKQSLLAKSIMAAIAATALAACQENPSVDLTSTNVSQESSATTTSSTSNAPETSTDVQDSTGVTTDTTDSVVEVPATTDAPADQGTTGSSQASSGSSDMPVADSGPTDTSSTPPTDTSTDTPVDTAPVEVMSKSIDVSWSANAESDLSYYVLYHGKESGHYDERIDVGNTTYFQFDTTDAGTHYFALSAVDVAGNESSLSEENSIDVASIN